MAENNKISILQIQHTMLEWDTYFIIVHLYIIIVPKTNILYV